MAMFTMSHEALRAWVESLIGTQTVIAPKLVEGLYLFRPVSTVDEISLDFTQTTVSPKEWFFPISETLFTVERQDREIVLRHADTPGPRVLFGMRPCDAMALTVLDHLFLAPPADQLYGQRRDNTALIGLACDKQQLPECFCTSLSGGPQDTTNLDILLAESGHGYVVQVLTERGIQLLAGAQMREGGAMPAPPEIRNAVPTSGTGERLRRHFDAPYWSRLADRCLGCKICTYVCPTCHCFDVRDCQVEGQTERVRCWDGCQSALFTRLAGGYNPRASKAARLRQFYAHKYVYFPERFGVTQCVGCGRCAHACPVNIDIRETLSNLQKLEAESNVVRS